MTSESLLYLFHGDDDLRIDEAVEALIGPWRREPNGDLNTTDLDGMTASAGEVIAAASAYPFLAARRVVVVRGMLAWIARKGAGDTGKKAVELLENELPGLPDYARLLFVERAALSESHKILKLSAAQPIGSVRFFAVPDDSTDWIIRRAKQVYNTVIEPQAAAALASVTPGDPRRADNELIKLTAYVDGRAITESDVALLTPYVSEASMFAMVDALAEGRTRQASHLLHKLLEQQGEDPFGMYGMVARQFRLLLLTKEHFAAGGGSNMLAEAIGQKKFVADKLARQSRAFELTDLEEVYRQIGEYDFQIKTGQIGIELALDLLIAGLAARR
ncbi:MAG: DNA polymerase III subunit delta [Anaerolineae bacterium]|nr:DNA polymerase III subunit delta [Anaerolineae bacterium]NUQ05590.1 DNA polymerase III subunit delta [Anaerolineae bacterium]